MSGLAPSEGSHSELEEKANEDTHTRDEDHLARVSTRGSNVQAIPGVPLDEADFLSDGSQEPDGQGGLEAVPSRASSFNPGPPPDGGTRAWICGESPSCRHGNMYMLKRDAV